MIRVYDLAHDPDEQKDLWGEASAEVGTRAVLDPLWLWRAFNPIWKKSDFGNAANATAQLAAQDD